jgi:hypothetical protein
MTTHELARLLLVGDDVKIFQTPSRLTENVPTDVALQGAQMTLVGPCHDHKTAAAIVTLWLGDQLSEKTSPATV